MDNYMNEVGLCYVSFYVVICIIIDCDFMEILLGVIKKMIGRERILNS